VIDKSARVRTESADWVTAVERSGATEHRSPWISARRVLGRSGRRDLRCLAGTVRSSPSAECDPAPEEGEPDLEYAHTQTAAGGGADPGE
jgi:hypothetical protein